MRPNPDFKSFGPDGYVTDPNEILLKVAMENPIVYGCVSAYRNGALSWEQAMMSAVKFLVTQNKSMFEELVKQANERITPWERKNNE